MSDALWHDFDSMMDQSDDHRKFYTRVKGYALYDASLLPPKPDEKLPLQPVGFHHDLFPVEGKDWRVGVPCLKVPWKLRCPVCDAINFAVAQKLVHPKDPFIAGESDAGPKSARGVRTKMYALARMIFHNFKTNPGWQGEAYQFGEFPAWRVVLLPKVIAVAIRNFYEDEEHYGPKAICDFEQSHPIVMNGDAKNRGHWDINVSVKPRPIPEGFRNFDYWDIWCSYEHVWKTATEEEILKQIEEKQNDLPDWFIEAVQGSRELQIEDVPGPPSGSAAMKALPPITKVTELT